jgi:D-arabinose 1-dehydrogenase-like Zn-dependent alcohol dehydrogenase
VWWKQLSVLGSTMGSPDDFRAVLELVADGRVRPVVDTVFPLDRAADAHERMESSVHFGKIALRISA